MSIAGIICEYNPFHGGHAYHIARTRELTGAEYVVCVMSGSFVQRGQPAVYDKFRRTEAALSGGADLVLELPVAGSLRSAQGFARAGVRTLAAIGADFISFGAEDADLNELSRIADILHSEPDDYRERLRAALDGGLSFPAARSLAADTRLLDKPNNILAVEYLCAIKKYGFGISPVAVERRGDGYHDTATRLRRELTDIVTAADFDRMVTYALRSNPQLVPLLPDAGEGLSNRIAEAARHSSAVESIIDGSVSKRYTRTRISRILFCALLGMTQELIDAYDAAPVTRIRALGGRPELLSMLSKRVLITTAPSPDDEFLRFDTRAYEIYSAVLTPPDAASEYTRGFIRI